LPQNQKGPVPEKEVDMKNEEEKKGESESQPSKKYLMKSSTLKPVKIETTEENNTMKK
jgi:hypothetical protein